MRGHISFGRDDRINLANFLANLAILYVSVQILGVSRNNAGYNAGILRNTSEINKNLSCRKKESE